MYEESPLKKISATVKTERIKEWNTAFPILRRYGSNRLLRIVDGFAIGVELCWGRFDTSEYNPYICIDCIFSKYKPYVFFPYYERIEHITHKPLVCPTNNKIENIEEELKNLSNSHVINTIKHKEISVSELINILEKHATSDRTVFGYLFSTYRAILYLYSIANISEQDKEYKYNYYMNEINKNEEGFGRIYKDEYLLLKQEIDLYFIEPEKIKQIIENNINIKKFDKLNKTDLIL
jgi:hypothetical protein